MIILLNKPQYVTMLNYEEIVFRIKKLIMGREPYGSPTLS